MGRPREHDDTTAERLLDAAEELLSDGGMDAVTVRAVADEVGVSVRAVYSTYGGKDELIGALVGRSFDRLRERVTALEETDDPWADLSRVAIDGFRAYALDKPHLYALAFEQVRLWRRVPPPWIESGEGSRQALVRWVTRAIGDTDQRRIDDVTAQFHAVCQGLASCELNTVWRAMGIRQPRRMWRETIDAYLGSVAASVTV